MAANCNGAGWDGRGANYLAVRDDGYYLHGGLHMSAAGAGAGGNPGVDEMGAAWLTRLIT
jgi:hypothetical protein